MEKDRAIRRDIHQLQEKTSYALKEQEEKYKILKRGIISHFIIYIHIIYTH